ncbi:hypothetical protein HSX11_03545 [Oxalobacteraceae bacterium]|nr:hypothetical protein [Oxalobacteraceae bacterium]
MDQQKLRTLVFEKTGVRVDTDDPIFALVALNEAVLAEAVERHVARIDAASHELLARAGAPSGANGANGAAHNGVPATGGMAGIGLDHDPAAGAKGGDSGTGQAGAAPAAGPAHATATAAAFPLTPRELRLLGAAAGVAVLSALLVLGGQALLFKPQPIPAPVYQAKALTPEQTAALRDGEKLARAVQKLDPKSRGLIQAEMQKP